ncbi:hypothetical protein CRG98_003427 [Punica granatum]|uniref:Retrotransposon Copia-like N-terminal domain-containing protein n=1 Tax=Punica granatum TaxID=22663 RepID=A0A2I0L6E2_PUNGR|nr:hypothetical protein CRG98_003427 [Punica granatum]
MTKKEDKEGGSGKGMRDSAVYRIGSSNSTGVQITSCLLNGENYLTWSRAMTIALTAKGKLGFVEGRVPKPPPGDSNLENWEMCNSLVLAWIFNGLERELQSSAAYATEAKVLWDDLKERYSQGNETRIYQLKSDVCLYRQGGKTIQKYYSGIKTLWDELENYLEQPGCSCEAAARYAAQREKEKAYQFLMGLDDQFRNVRSDILRTMPLPTLSRIYQMVSEEENQFVVARSRETAVGQQRANRYVIIVVDPATSRARAGHSMVHLQKETKEEERRYLGKENKELLGSGRRPDKLQDSNGKGRVKAFRIHWEDGQEVEQLGVVWKEQDPVVAIIHFRDFQIPNSRHCSI